MNKLVVVTGGARSGKSSFVQSTAEWIYNMNMGKKKKDIAYIATGEPMDDEFQERIKIHKENRPSYFITYEEPLFLDTILRKELAHHDIFIIECMTTWLGNVFHKKVKPGRDSFLHKTVDSIFDTFLNLNTSGDWKSAGYFQKYLISGTISTKFFAHGLLKIHKRQGKILFVVTNELGLGVVPNNPVAREFRDKMGAINQRLTMKADYVVFTHSGIPTIIKKK
jgi:adenosyl cobinamide kinase/adenosyl cobinamide phosphate guanylyltransferase